MASNACVWTYVPLCSLHEIALNISTRSEKDEHRSDEYSPTKTATDSKPSRFSAPLPAGGGGLRDATCESDAGTDAHTRTPAGGERQHHKQKHPPTPTRDEPIVAIELTRQEDRRSLKFSRQAPSMAADGLECETLPAERALLAQASDARTNSQICCEPVGEPRVGANGIAWPQINLREQAEQNVRQTQQLCTP